MRKNLSLHLNTVAQKSREVLVDKQLARGGVLRVPCLRITRTIVGGQHSLTRVYCVERSSVDCALALFAALNGKSYRRMPSRCTQQRPHEPTLHFSNGFNISNYSAKFARRSASPDIVASTTNFNTLYMHIHSCTYNFHYQINVHTHNFPQQ